MPASSSRTADDVIDLSDEVDHTRDRVRRYSDAAVTLIEYGEYECPQAADLGLDVGAFWDDVHGHGHADRIAEDVASADASGVAGTPSFFINGRRHEGAYDLATVSNAVRAARSCVSARRVAPARAADISRQGLYLHFANKEALFRAAVRQELDTALGDVSGCLKKEGVGLERRVVGALDAWLGRYAGSMLASDIGNLLQDPAMELGDIVDPAIAAFDARLAAAIAAAMSEKDRRRLAVTPEEIAAAVHTLAQGARHLSNARAESRAQFLARVTAGVRVVFAGLGTTARRTP